MPVSFPGSCRTSLMTSCEASSWAPGLATQKSVVLPVCFSCSSSSWCCRVGGPVVAVFFPSRVCPIWRSGETRCPSWCWSRVAFAKWRSRSFSSCLPGVVRVWQISVRGPRTILDGAGYGTPHSSSMRCPSVAGVSFWRRVASSLQSRRVIALPGRSRTLRAVPSAPGL